MKGPHQWSSSRPTVDYEGRPKVDKVNINIAIKILTKVIFILMVDEID
jgi:hypothetical protein